MLLSLFDELKRKHHFWMNDSTFKTLSLKLIKRIEIHNKKDWKLIISRMLSGLIPMQKYENMSNAKVYKQNLTEFKNKRVLVSRRTIRAMKTFVGRIRNLKRKQEVDCLRT